MTILAWNESRDGKIAKAFIEQCLSRNEIKGRGINRAKHSKKSCDNQFSLDVRSTLVDIILAWTDDNAGGVSKSFISYEKVTILSRVTHILDSFIKS